MTQGIMNMMSVAFQGVAFRDAGKLAVLLDRRLTGASIDADEQHWLVLHTDAGDVVLEAEGDCCSESWFYEVTGLVDLFGHVITGGATTDMGDATDEITRQEYDQIYGVTLEAAGAGRADIVFRNSSNGYYGGWLNVLEAIPADVRLVPITGDYVAQVTAADASDE